MRNRVLWAAGTLAAFVPALLLAQQRPAQPPAQRPAAQPAQRPAAQPAARPLMAQYAGPHREGSWELSAGVGGMLIDKQLQVLRREQHRPRRRRPHRLQPQRKWNFSVGSQVYFVSPLTFFQPFVDITWTPDINKATAPFVTAGFGMGRVNFSGGHFTSQYGAQLGVGLRHMLGERLALRVEATEQYEKYQEPFITTPCSTAARPWACRSSWAAARRDTDVDGVPDKNDQCANTPAGARVQSVTTRHGRLPDRHR